VIVEVSRIKTVIETSEKNIDGEDASLAEDAHRPTNAESGRVT
jgi:hypothetical protein